MGYINFEIELTELLKNLGWISSYTSDRQDSYITWTEYGKNKHSNFLSEVKQIYNYDEDYKVNFLIPFCHYHRILERTKREKTISEAKQWICDDNFLVITCTQDGSMTFNVFKSKNDENAYAIMESANDNNEEVIIIEMSELQKSNARKITPFGARGFYRPLKL